MKKTAVLAMTAAMAAGCAGIGPAEGPSMEAEPLAAVQPAEGSFNYFFVRGAVAHPACYSFSRTMTLGGAVARARGAPLSGATQKVSVTRDGASIPKVLPQDTGFPIRNGDVVAVEP